MSVRSPDAGAPRRTSANDVFERMRADIVTLRLPPGARLSEAEFARKFDVSRQPVREAFIRLSNINLVQIRPQRATIVRRISKSEILETRFIRTALEVEIVMRACGFGIAEFEEAFQGNLAAQRQAVEAQDTDRFNLLDYEFHHLLCKAGRCEFAYGTIAENKVYVDRLCMLSLSSKAGRQEVFDDHLEIFERLRDANAAGAIATMRLHLSRLNETLKQAGLQYPEYFDD